MILLAFIETCVPIWKSHTEMKVSVIFIYPKGKVGYLANKNTGYPIKFEK